MRLFWTFPDGLPGAGLLLIRIAVSSALLYRCASSWPPELNLPAALCGAELVSAIALLAGIWTPIGGALAVALELWRAVTDREDTLVQALLVTMSASLVLLGPGAISIDAWRFGWRRIDLPEPRREPSSSD